MDTGKNIMFGNVMHGHREKYNVWSSDKIRSSDSLDWPGAVETDNMAY